mmetsp:Transcript_5107/g.14032  ORF Transcript_5107/g.14032 Transcript_5107/m.14032 type:complete len:262 (+) Transcript_5107:107-892(+)
MRGPPAPRTRVTRTYTRRRTRGNGLSNGNALLRCLWQACHLLEDGQYVTCLEVVVHDVEEVEGVVDVGDDACRLRAGVIERAPLALPQLEGLILPLDERLGVHDRRLLHLLVGKDAPRDRTHVARHITLVVRGQIVAAVPCRVDRLEGERRVAGHGSFEQVQCLRAHKHLHVGFLVDVPSGPAPAHRGVVGGRSVHGWLRVDREHARRVEELEAAQDLLRLGGEGELTPREHGDLAADVAHEGGAHVLHGGELMAPRRAAL